MIQQFISNSDFLDKWDAIKAIIFDWDGVFNNGQKNLEGASTFSEVDSMGINMLRFSHYLKTNSHLLTGVITGEVNPIAQKFAEREKFNALYQGVKNKQHALAHFCNIHNIQPSEVLFVFDDIIDFGCAQECGLRFMINDFSKMQTILFAKKHQIADAITEQSGGQGAIRQLCEYLIDANNNIDETFLSRIAFDANYQTYWQNRNSNETAMLSYRLINNQPFFS